MEKSRQNLQTTKLEKKKKKGKKATGTEVYRYVCTLNKVWKNMF
jgi:hypothetical protein